jgi:hypothetical protein
MMGITLAITRATIFTIIMMCILPALIPRPSETKRQQVYILLMAIFVVLPIMLGVSIFINLSWVDPAESMLTTLYWIFIWAFLMPAVYMTMALGYKMGGGKPRHVFNIAFAGTLMQYSLLEDIFFYVLQGAPLPSTWPWLSNFIFPLESFFLHPGVAITTTELIIWLIFITIVSIIILFDIYGKIWDKIRTKQEL